MPENNASGGMDLSVSQFSSILRVFDFWLRFFVSFLRQSKKLWSNKTYYFIWCLLLLTSWKLFCLSMQDRQRTLYYITALEYQ